MTEKILPTLRASQIEYAIRDVVVPASKLEEEGHDILKLNIGDPLAYPGLPTPDHMVEAFHRALKDQRNGYSPAYGISEFDFQNLHFLTKFFLIIFMVIGRVELLTLFIIAKKFLFKY